MFCSPITRCPDSKPYLCSDGSCASNSELCPTVQCKKGWVMCGDGSCVDKEVLCPHRIVSFTMVVRCSDGSIRSTEGYQKDREQLFGEAPAFEKCVARKLEESIVGGGMGCQE